MSALWFHFYDAAGRQIRQVDPKAAITETRYDRQGRVLQRNDPDPDQVNSVMIYPYAVTIVSNGTAAAPIHKFNYDAVGNLVRQIDPRGSAPNRA